MLDGRDIKLLDIIEAHPDIDPVELATRFSVSDRSVRTYVRKTNEALGSCAQIEKRRGGGYLLRVLNASAFAALRARDAHAGQGSVPTTPEARVDYLLNDLLSRADWITVDDLANILFVSRNVITGDLKQVAATLERFGLTLEKRPHYGIRVTGPEMSRRLCLANLTLDGIIGSGGVCLARRHRPMRERISRRGGFSDQFGGVSEFARAHSRRGRAYPRQLLRPYGARAS